MGQFSLRRLFASVTLSAAGIAIATAVASSPWLSSDFVASTLLWGLAGASLGSAGENKVSELFLGSRDGLPSAEPTELPSLYRVARTEKSSRVAHKLRLTDTVHMYIIRSRVPLRPGAPGFALWKFDTNPTRKRGRRAWVPLLPCRAVLRSVHLADGAFYPSTLYTMDRISAILSPHAPAPLALTLGPFDSSTF